MKIIIILFLTIISNSNSLDMSPGKIIEETSKLEKAKEIFDNIKDSEFVKTMKSASKWGLPLLKSLNYFSKIILGEMGGESKELKYMKEQFAIINSKMTLVDREFEEVKKFLDWNVIKVQYATYEMSIDVLQDMIQHLFQAPPSVQQMMKDRFLNTYDQMYHSACDKLYESIVNTQRIFSENLGTAVKKFTNNHRRKVEEFFMGNIKLIFNGLKVETFYLSLKNLSGNDDYWINLWDKRIQEITNVMELTVQEITSNWRQQLEEDTETFNIYNNQKNNEQYLGDFYAFLNEKFSWRLWFVVIYNPISGEDSHFVSVYDGLIKFRSRNHNVVLGSRENNGNGIQQNLAQQVVNNVPTNIFCRDEGPAKCLLMSYLIPKLQISGSYSLAAVIEWGAGVWYAGPSSGRVYRKWQGIHRNNNNVVQKTFNIIVMG